MFYAGLYAIRWVLNEIVSATDGLLVQMEQRSQIVASWTISARRFTAADNKVLWNTYDWSKGGEEWTRSAEWKAGLVHDYLEPNVAEGSAVVEIGPGGGRWTEILCGRAARVTVVDVSEKALAICRSRFQSRSNIEYLLSDGRSIALPSAGADAIWSYDVFVHINPNDARGYFHEFVRVLKPGGRAVVHHPGEQSLNDREHAWRSDLTAAMVTSFAEEAGLRVLSQTRGYVNAGDVLSVFEKVAR